MCGWSRALRKGTWGSGDIAPRIVNAALDGGEWSYSLSGRFTPIMNLPGPIQKEATLATCGHFVEDEIFGPPTWNRNTIPRPSSRWYTHYTDWDIVARSVNGLVIEHPLWMSREGPPFFTQFTFTFGFLLLQWLIILETVEYLRSVVRWCSVSDVCCVTVVRRVNDPPSFMLLTSQSKLTVSAAK